MEAGVTHFDVAPMYGLGFAEQELGRFARGRRDRISLATKFGIAMTRPGRLLGTVQGPLRRLLEASPRLRESARTSAAGPGTGPAGTLLYRATGFDARAARRSLEASLRSLQTDHLDLFLMHDPLMHQVQAEVAEFLEDARARGLIESWGLAGELVPSLEVIRQLNRPLPVLQIRDDIFLRAVERVPARLGARLLTFGSLGVAIGRIVNHVRLESTRRSRWNRTVDSDCGDPDAVALLLLAHARRCNADGITLFSTTRVERVQRAVAASTTCSADQVGALLGLVERELSDRPTDAHR